MKLAHAIAIDKAASEMGVEVTLYEEYSGRGMYGKTTAGVVGRLNEIIACIAQAAVRIAWLEEPEYDPQTSNDFVSDMKKLSWDSMGRSDMIVY